MANWSNCCPNAGSSKSGRGSAASAIISGTLRPRDCPGTWLLGDRRPSRASPASNQGHEHDTAEILFLEIRLAATSDLQQRLLSFLLAHRNDQPATDGELLLQ